MMRLLAAPLAVALLCGGALVLTAAPAGAVEVSTEAELRAAFDSENEITLLNDITLTDCEEGDVDRTDAVGPLTLDGQGFSIIQTCDDRVLDVNNDADLTLKNVTITGGNTNSDGGGLDMDNGHVTIIESQFLDNCAQDGGGVEAESMTILRSTFAGNVAAGDGGAYTTDDESGGTTAVNSTFTGNKSRDTGALDEDGQRLTLIYSTVSDNVLDPTLPACVVENGIAAAEAEEAEAPDSDDAEIGAAQGPAANVTTSFGEGLTSFATVVANPIGGENCELNDPAAVESLGFNYSDDASCGFTGTGDTENGPNPQLGALAANGGPTLTMLPAATSPLIDRVPVAECRGPDGDVTTDQRGVTRPQGAGCDIGAVELEPVAPPPAPPLVLEPRFTG